MSSIFKIFEYPFLNNGIVQMKNIFENIFVSSRGFVCSFCRDDSIFSHFLYQIQMFTLFNIIFFSLDYILQNYLMYLIFIHLLAFIVQHTLITNYEI